MLVGMDFGAVTFVERGGAGARDALRALQERLEATGLASRLLASRDDDSLHLLLIEGDPSLSGPEAEGARTWRFRDVPGPAASRPEAGG